MRIRRDHRRAVMVLLTTVSAVILAATSGPALAQSSPRPSIFPATSAPYANTYGDWSVAWWQWAFSLPVAGHPLFDETGENCGAGQSGPVWFLGGVFNVSGTAARDECVVPAGKALFFPILNVEASNVEGNGTTETELRAAAASIADGAANLVLEVDGISFQKLRDFRVPGLPFTPPEGVRFRDLRDFRVPSPAFHFTLPEDNFLEFFGVRAPAGTCFPVGDLCQPYRSIGDGFYVMLAPLPPGPHSIHFGGSFPAFNFTLDITYNLTVQP